MNAWTWVKRGLVMAGAVLLAGLMRDPARSHLVPRDSFVAVLVVTVASTAGMAVLVGARELAAGPRQDRVATAIAGALGLLFLPPLEAAAEYHGHGVFSCGREAWSYDPGSTITACTLCAFALVAVALIVDRDRRRAWRCLALVVAFASSVSFWPQVLTRDSGKPSAYRRCYANQKTVAGAVEMYNLDRNTKRTVLDEAFFQTLLSGGYLQSLPRDPGGITTTSANYTLTTTSQNGITCRWHGAIQ